MAKGGGRYLDDRRFYDWDFATQNTNDVWSKLAAGWDVDYGYEVASV